MKVLWISIDSLNRHYLPMYDASRPGPDVRAPNLARFAERALTFDRHYAGSLPCLPARREWLCGIQEFLWRPWGPVEPYDRTIPARCRKARIPSALITDHFHYFQHGAGGYFEDYNGYEFVRGHEFDAWKTAPPWPQSDLVRQILHADREHPSGVNFLNRVQYARNVQDFEQEADFFAPRVFRRAREWLRDNHGWDEWFCYVDCFDVHEPFHCPEPYASMYTDEDPRDPDLSVWPYYGTDASEPDQFTDRQLEFVRAQYAGKITMVDRWLGEVFDELDEQNAWSDTVVVVSADHGHYLGEHGLIGKPLAPVYNELARLPLMIWHPDGTRAGEHTTALTASVDLYATLLEGLEIEADGNHHSRSLMGLVRGETDTHRDWTLFGYWGAGVNVTDGDHTYLHPCREDVQPACYSATMMNPHLWFLPPRPRPDAEAGDFLPYAETPVWRYEADPVNVAERARLFDVREDPAQASNLVEERPKLRRRMKDVLVEALRERSAPNEQYRRLGLEDALRD